MFFSFSSSFFTGGKEREEQTRRWRKKKKKLAEFIANFLEGFSLHPDWWKCRRVFSDGNIVFRRYSDREIRNAQFPCFWRKTRLDISRSIPRAVLLLILRNMNYECTSNECINLGLQDYAMLLWIRNEREWKAKSYDQLAEIRQTLWPRCSR